MPIAAWGTPTPPRIGVIVNPIAGIGGRVGLKGSDGTMVRRARAMGAVPEAGERARRTLAALHALAPSVELIAAPGEMGADAACAAGYEPRVLGTISAGSTTSADTRRIAVELRGAGVQLLLFVGGDGTARDIVDAVDRSIPVLGVAAGVKVYSAVFAINPERAAEIVDGFLRGHAPTREGEVLDLDETAYRQGRVSPSLYGHLCVPARPDAVQGGKDPSPAGERVAAAAIAAEVTDLMEPGRGYILGPGTTTRAIADRLGLSKTLVGVDVVTRDGLVMADATESGLRAFVRSQPTTVIVTPIGGQGFVFGRGNPQIGPRVLAGIDRRDIVVVATPGKLAALRGRPFLVDTGDPAVDASLVGYVRTITGYRERTVYRLSI